MIILRPERVLLYYDQPQLFTAVDQLGTKYVCLFTDTNEQHAEYIAVPLSPNKFNALILGHLDLREAFLTSETGLWYKLISKDENVTHFDTESLASVDVTLLPDSGFFLPALNPDNESIYAEVAEDDKTVLHLAFVDKNNSHSMPVDILADFMKLFQGLVKNVYKKAISEMTRRRELDRPENYTLDAFATSVGSFNLHLRGRSESDLFGNNHLDMSLIRIDQIVSEIGTEEELLDRLRPYKGHAIATYKRLLEKIINTDINLSYHWASPSGRRINAKTINKQYAEKVYQIIISKTDLGQEIKELIGFVKQVDVEKGNWRILNTSDNKEYSGQAHDRRLDGITVETVEYVFKCEEILEELKMTEQGKAKYVLIDFWEVSRDSNHVS